MILYKMLDHDDALDYWFAALFLDGVVYNDENQLRSAKAKVVLIDDNLH